MNDRLNQGIINPGECSLCQVFPCYVATCQGAFINDVTQILTHPIPLSHIYALSSLNALYLFPLCMPSFIIVPLVWIFRVKYSLGFMIIQGKLTKGCNTFHTCHFKQQ